ncbi:isochorismatase domain-containing protein 1 isoform X3 [Rhineura floridana]|uniref:isochorismatase domain-containing protein 1 isoform X3 n=1 Tax=Rhineura floridana TaxID=261503 RepID=UPI002AC853D4|nr:isochorismatase domain-containing protein 1 isoform X3 [Rhineura floridana]
MVRRRSRSRDWGPPAPPAWPVGGNASSSRRSCSNSSGGAEPERLPPNMAAAEQQQQQHFTEAVVAPPLASGGREATCGSAGSSPGSVPVLFCFSVFARPSTVPHGSGYEVLIQKFLSLYGDQLDMHRKFVVQLFSEEWSQYIDLPKGFLVSDRCKVRLVPLQIQTHPQGHKGKIPSHPQCSRFGGGDEISQLTPEEQRPGSPPSPAKHTGVRITTLGNLTPSSTVFFCCDMQERFRPAIKYFGDIISVSQRLLQGARILGIPVIVTEQYPKGLGSTVQEIDLTGAKLVLPKTKFSMVLPEVESAIAEIPGVRSVVLFGVEVDSCVHPTDSTGIGRQRSGSSHCG